MFGDTVSRLRALKADTRAAGILSELLAVLPELSLSLRQLLTPYYVPRQQNKLLSTSVFIEIYLYQCLGMQKNTYIILNIIYR